MSEHEDPPIAVFDLYSGVFGLRGDAYMIAAWCPDCPPALPSYVRLAGVAGDGDPPALPQTYHSLRLVLSEELRA